MPPIPQAVAQVYRDLVFCLGALRNLAAIVALITLAFEILEALLVPSGAPTLGLLLRFVSGLAQGFLVVPYYIAVHRLIILGERTPSYVLEPSSPRFQQFFWWWAAFSVIAFASLFVVEMLPRMNKLEPLPFLIAMLPLLIVLVAVTIATLRLTLILPAVAVDAPGARWDAVLADTKGHAWRIFLLGLVAALPLIVAVLIAFVLIAIGIALGGWIFGLLYFVLGPAWAVVAMTLFIVIASRLYLWLGHRVKTG